MQREFLFKARRIDWEEWVEEDQWVYGNLVRVGDRFFIAKFKTYIRFPDELDIMESVEVVPTTICQYTGLTDKNGNKIWENDIVEFLGHKGVVKYACGGFGIAFNDCIDWEEIESSICPVTGCDNALYACENDNFISLWEIYWNFNDVDNVLNMVEVVGNIFDNPELLEVEQHEAD